MGEDGKQTGRSRTRSVAVELALLVAVVAVPLAGLAAFLLYDSAQRELDHASGVAQQVAATTVDRAQSQVAVIGAALGAIAKRPLVVAMDADRCDPELAELLRLYPQAANIIVVEREGRIICGAVPPPRDRVVRIVDEDLRREMLADPRLRFSKPLIGRISNRWTVTAVQPVFSPGGVQVGSVAMSLDLLNWISFAGVEGLPEGAVMTVVTAQGTIIARSVDAAKWVGTVRQGEIHRRMLERKQGRLSAAGVEGRGRLWGFAPVPGTDWFALAGVPEDAVYQSVRARIFGAIALLLVVLAAALSAALSLIARLLRPLRGIARAVRGRAGGNAQMRVPVAGPREVEELAQELNRMIDAGERILSEQVEHDEDLKRFRAAMDISGDAILLIDRATLRYIDVNQTFCDLVGYARDEVLGMTPMDIFSADRATLERDYDEIIADGNCPVSRIEGWYRRKDGSRFQVETRRRALQTKEGWILVATARDITERKVAEERIARLNRVYAVLSGINAAIVRIHDRDELFAEACRIAVEHGRMQMAWMGVVDRAANEVKLIAWRGGDERFVKSLPGRNSMRVDAEGGPGIVARAVIGKAPVVSNDVVTDERVKLKTELTALGIRSLAVLPMVVDGETVAVLALHAADAGYFDEQEMKLLLELAGDIAFALRHIEQQEKLDYLAYYDSLTGFANRNLFIERLNQYIHTAGQTGGKLGLVVADVERLRTVNDSLGRQAGDALLKELAGRLTRGADLGELARISADHFAILLPGVKGRSAVTRRFERLWQACFGAPFVIEGADLRIAGKAGIALFPNDGIDAETLIRNAEAALRSAKQTGERHVFHAAEMTERSAEKLSLENRLRRALERDELVLHYQPKIELETRRIVGVEALLRWQSPELGLVPPGQFIPLMEETGMILEAGAWAMDRAVRDHRRWVEMGLKAPRVAVNVSAVQLRKKDYLDALAQSLARGVSPAGIDLEITESLVMEDIQGNIEKLKGACRLGVTIAIDDFGTGYSSLSYLAKLPVQALKIDRSFIITMLAEPDTMTLVSTIISLAHSLKLKVIAEGVDAEEQAKFLRLLRCDQMQGYLFSRPVPFDGIIALLGTPP